MKTVYIIILHYSNLKDTLACIDSCLKLKTGNFNLKIILVDNNPGVDLKGKIAKKILQKIEIIVNKKNYGFAQGNNIGIKRAMEKRADYLLILNNDTVVDKNLLIQLFKVLEKNQHINIVSPKIYFAPGYEFHKERYNDQEKGKVIWYAGGHIDWNNIYASHLGVNEVDRGQYDRLKLTDFATGCCMLVKKEVFSKTGFFNQKYFLYWEDVAFCQKAKQAGFSSYYCPQGFIYHKNAVSSSVGSELQDYYQTRNRLLFGWHYAGLRVKLNLVKQSLLRLFKGRKWEKRGIVDFYRANFGKGSFKYQ